MIILYGLVTIVSIPQSEFCPLGHSMVGRFAGNAVKVSIPQSEFCPLGRALSRAAGSHRSGFNSSVGILSVGTWGPFCCQGDIHPVSIPQSEFCPLGPCDVRSATVNYGTWFQFLSRNSVRWDASDGADGAGVVAVSIPQSEFCPLGQLLGVDSPLESTKVSIPQSEFCPLGLMPTPLLQVEAVGVSIPQSEFCPLGPRPMMCRRSQGARFQFLSRNSVRWDLEFRERREQQSHVSIPQSEFCPLGHRPWPVGKPSRGCFNSSVGILSVGTYGGPPPLD